MAGEFITLTLVAIVVFLIGREIVCWYWKMNETISLLKEIRDLLKSSVSEESKMPMEEPTSVLDKFGRF